MNATTPQRPVQSESVPSHRLPLVLVRANVPAQMFPLMDFQGSPAKNEIGLAALAQAIRASLGLPPDAVLSAWEMRAGFIWVECGSMAPATVIADALAVLQALNHEEYFSILLLDRREEFFRPYHQGQYCGDCSMVTFDQVAAEAAAFRQEKEKRLAYFKKIMDENPT
jgi:hypothetical protein